MMRLARLLLLFLAALTLGLPAQAQQRRVALLIGNASYAVGPLRNPPTDVRVMDEALRVVGFQTQVVLNANQNTMKRAVRDFGSRAQGADVAFLYYSGHGTQVGGENYLIPLEAIIDKESDYEVEAVSANAVLRQIAGARPKAAVVVLDACRDNPLAAVAKTGAKGLVRMEAPTGTLIAFATAPNTTASDEGHYARVLGAQLRKPGVELLDAFRNTTAEVLRLSAGRQEPRVSEVSITDRIYLAGTQVASIRPEPVTPGLDLADLHQQASHQVEKERREQVALARMQSDFDKVSSFTGAPELQARAWDRFLAAWSEGNVPGEAGRGLRRQAEGKLAEARNTAARRPPAVDAGIGKACPECPETVLLQPGSFQMGSPSSEVGRADDEGPVHTVRIGYRLAVGKTDVTKGEFAAFVSATGYRTEAEQRGGCAGLIDGKAGLSTAVSWRNVGFEQGNDHPVVCVSWNDAQRYIEWLNSKSPLQGWRLLSEAEWEYAVRAGTSSRYFWGDDPGNNQQCRFANGADQFIQRSWKQFGKGADCDDGVVYTSPVGRFKPNAWGLLDLAGNVLQWTQDCYAKSYDSAPTDGSAMHSPGCSRRVHRGGFWGQHPLRLRSSARGESPPDSQTNWIGFRLARTVL